MPAIPTPTSTLPLVHAHERKNGQEPGYAKWFTPVSLLNVSLRTELLDEAALAWRPLESIPSLKERDPPFPFIFLFNW